MLFYYQFIIYETNEKDIPKEVVEYSSRYKKVCDKKILNSTSVSQIGLTNRLLISELNEENKLLKEDLCSLGVLRWC